MQWHGTAPENTLLWTRVWETPGSYRVLLITLRYRETPSKAVAGKSCFSVLWIPCVP